MSELLPCNPPQCVAAKATIPDLNVMFSEAKERVSDTSEEAERLYQRSMTLLAIAITALTGIIGYLGTNWKFNVLNANLLFICAILWMISAKLKDNIKPQSYMTKGTQPNKLFTKDFYFDLEEGKTAEWYMLFNLVRDYQCRINENIKKNESRAINIRESIDLLYAIPFGSALIWAAALVFLPAEAYS